MPKELDKYAINTLIDVYKKLRKNEIPRRGNGWVLLAVFGKSLSQFNFNYKDYRPGKLVDFIKSLNFFEVYIDEKIAPPVVYIRFTGDVGMRSDEKKSKNQTRAEQGKNFHSSAEKELFEIWGVSGCNFIGYYHFDETKNLSTVDDIRKPNFAKIPYYPNDPDKNPISIPFNGEIKGITPENYYLFNWRLSGNNPDNPYEIYIDFHFQPQPIRPQWFIDQLFADRYNDKSKNFESSANFLDTLSKQLSAKESTFIYELLQNANDYPVNGVPVDVESHITDKYLVFMHSGDYFNVRNISGICGINEKEKSANIKTIGYKGIGFKTVFLNNHYVYIKTGDYSLYFSGIRLFPVSMSLFTRA